MNVLKLIESEAELNDVDIEILRILNENQGRVVKRQRLLECWGDRVVADGSLSVSIKKIRGTLKKLGLGNVIHTHPRRGYMLIPLSETHLCNERKAEQSSLTSLGKSVRNHKSRPRKFRSLTIVIPLLIVLVSLFILTLM